MFAAQNLPITSAGNEDDPRAKVFTRDCLIACRKFLEHLVSEDEEFCARFGPTSIPPVISNDNIVLLDTESMVHFHRIREHRACVSNYDMTVRMQMPNCRRLGVGREAAQPTKELKRLCKDGQIPRQEFMVDRLQVQSFAASPLDNVLLHSQHHDGQQQLSRLKTMLVEFVWHGRLRQRTMLKLSFAMVSWVGHTTEQISTSLTTLRADALTYIAQDMTNRLRQDIHETAEKDEDEAEWETILCGLSTQLDALAQGDTW